MKKQRMAKNACYVAQTFWSVDIVKNGITLFLCLIIIIIIAISCKIDLQICCDHQMIDHVNCTLISIDLIQVTYTLYTFKKWQE